MNWDVVKLFIISLGTLALIVESLWSARNSDERLMSFSILIGLFFFSGIGGGVHGVSWSYVVYYFGTAIAIMVGLKSSVILFSGIGGNIGRVLSRRLGEVDGATWRMVIFVYLIIYFVPIVWPHWQIYKLFQPPDPNLKHQFIQHFKAATVGEKILEYFRVLMTPFALLALYPLRRSLKWVFVFFALICWFTYVSHSYIGRGQLAVYFAICVIGIWYARPEWRGWVVVTCVIAFPIALYGAFVYARVRIGGSVGSMGVMEGAWDGLKSQLEFPSTVGMPLIKSGATANLWDYFTWICALPIPKILTGPIRGARVNYEISKAVLGVYPSASGGYVVLPGLVAESVFIFGKQLFWIHGIFIGLLAGFFVSIFSRFRQSLFIFIYIIVMFGYVLNRGGISSLLPPLINGFIAFFIFLFIASCRNARRPRQRLGTQGRAANNLQSRSAGV